VQEIEAVLQEVHEGKEEKERQNEEKQVHLRVFFKVKTTLPSLRQLGSRYTKRCLVCLLPTPDMNVHIYSELTVVIGLRYLAGGSNCLQ
jgi:hypothetical protein